MRISPALTATCEICHGALASMSESSCHALVHLTRRLFMMIAPGIKSGFFAVANWLGSSRLEKIFRSRGYLLGTSQVTCNVFSASVVLYSGCVHICCVSYLDLPLMMPRSRPSTLQHDGTFCLQWPDNDSRFVYSSWISVCSLAGV